MDDLELSGGKGGGPRRRRSALERRRIVEETLEAGASVARVALKYGVNANQVFQWRRLHRDGKLGGPSADAMKLLPVSVVEDQVAPKAEPEASVAERCGAMIRPYGPSTDRSAVLLTARWGTQQGWRSRRR